MKTSNKTPLTTAELIEAIKACSDAKLAEIVGVTQRTIYNRRNNQQPWNFWEVTKLANHFTSAPERVFMALYTAG